MNIAWPMEKY